MTFSYLHISTDVVPNDPVQFEYFFAELEKAIEGAFWNAGSSSAQHDRIAPEILQQNFERIIELFQIHHNPFRVQPLPSELPIELIAVRDFMLNLRRQKAEDLYSPVLADSAIRCLVRLERICREYEWIAECATKTLDSANTPRESPPITNESGISDGARNAIVELRGSFSVMLEALEKSGVPVSPSDYLRLLEVHARNVVLAQQLELGLRDSSVELEIKAARARIEQASLVTRGDFQGTIDEYRNLTDVLLAGSALTEVQIQEIYLNAERSRAAKIEGRLRPNGENIGTSHVPKGPDDDRAPMQQ